MCYSHGGVLQRRAEAGGGDGQSCLEPVMASWPLCCQSVCLEQTLCLSASEETDWRPFLRLRVQTSHSICSLFYIRTRVWNSECVHRFTDNMWNHQTQESAITVWANQIHGTFFKSYIYINSLSENWWKTSSLLNGKTNCVFMCEFKHHLIAVRLSISSWGLVLLMQVF